MKPKIIKILFPFIKYFQRFRWESLQYLTPKIFKFLGRKWITNLIAIGALLISIRTCNNQQKRYFEQTIVDSAQAKKADSLEYQINALRYKPILEFIGIPEIIETNIISKTGFNPLLLKKNINKESDTVDVHLLDCCINLKTKFKVFNRGNCLANIIGYVTCDTLTDKSILREKLKYDSTIFFSERVKEYFKYHLLEKDTTDIIIEQDIHFMKMGTFTSHCLILYENELGILYDTYLWTVYEVLPIIINNKLPKNTKNIKSVRIKINNSNKLIKCKIANQSYNHYSPSEKERIQDIMFNCTLASSNRIRPSQFLSYKHEENAQLYIQKGELDSAISELDQAMMHYPSESAIYESKARIYIEKGNIDSVIAMFSKIIELNPKNAFIIRDRGAYYKKIGKYQLAMRDYNKSLSLNPNLPGTYHNRGNLYSILGTLDSAILDYGKSIRLNPKYNEPYVERAEKYFMIGEYDSAFSDLNRIIELDKDNYLAYLNRGTIYLIKEEYDLALKDYNRCLAQKRDIRPYFYRGIIYLEKNKLDSAITNFNNVLKLDSTFVTAYINKGIAYIEKSNIDSALYNLKFSLKYKPDNPEVYYYLGNAYSQINQSDSALVYFRKVITLDPDHPMALNNLAWCYAESNNNLNEALRMSMKAVKLVPSDPYFWGTLAQIYYLLGKYSKAKECNEKAKELAIDKEHLKSIEVRMRKLETKLKNVK